jgi:hypothetical protein
MHTIIAGRFDGQARADAAVSALEAKGFHRDQIAAFFVNPPGQHDLHGTHLDPDASAGAHDAGSGAMTGALAGTGVGAVVGLATVPFLGPVAAFAGAAVGTYVGSLTGALEKLGDAEATTAHSADAPPGNDDAPPRKSGMLVAVRAPSSSEQVSAITILHAQGAVDMEQMQGSITRSLWNDFDPLSAPDLVMVVQ